MIAMETTRKMIYAFLLPPVKPLPAIRRGATIQGQTILLIMEKVF
jgi:hypothetical protein